MLLLRVVTGNYAAKTSHKGKFQVNKQKGISWKVWFIRFKSKEKKKRKNKEKKTKRNRSGTYLRTLIEKAQRKPIQFSTNDPIFHTYNTCTYTHTQITNIMSV